MTSTNLTNTTSGVRFWSILRTLVLVTFLTVLVWLLAESRMIQTRTIELQVVLMSNTEDPEHQFVIRPAPNSLWESSIQVGLEGSLASLDQAGRELRGRIQLVVGDHIPARTGIHDLDLRSLIRTHPALVTHGVTIRSLSTEIASVEVDEILEIGLPVVVDVPASVALDGAARAIPQTISVRGPGSIIAGLEGRDLHARPSPEVIAAMTPGRLETIPGVAVNLPRSIIQTTPGWTPVLSPARVDVRMTIRTRTQTTTIDRLPIQILLAPGEAGRWNIALQPGNEDIVGIQLEGPAEALAMISDGSVTPTAVLPLSFQELERAITSKRVQIHGLPAGVVVNSELSEVGFTITPVQVPAQPSDETP